MAPYVKFRVTADWGDGFNGEITLVAGDDPLTDWSLSFLAPFTIDAMWTSANITSVLDGLITVSGVEWNHDLAPGQVATFGFTAARGETLSDMPTAFFLDGAAITAPSVSVADVTVTEAASSLTFTLALSDATGEAVSVNWATADGSATAGEDYLAAMGTVTFAPGETSKTITIDLLPDDVHEGRETFSLNLSGVSGASLADTQAVATIIDDDEAANNGAVGFISTSGNQFVDEAGNTIRIGAINWYGMETTRFAPDGLDQRNWMDMMDQMVELGFNTIRLPFSSEALAGETLPTNIDYRLNPDLAGLTPLEIIDKIVAYAGEIGMRVLLDRHRGEAGDSGNENGLWYDDTYSEQAWIDDWVMLADRYAGNPTVLGADLSNEPFNGTWGDGSATDWKAAAERAGNAILAANPNWLIVVEGTGWYDGEGYWWGGNLMGAADAPVELNVANRLVYSAHDYPPSLFPQSFFDDPAYPENLPALFEKMWGYLFTSGTAPVLLGEFGSSLTDAKDAAWVEKLVAYLNGDFNSDGVSDLAEGQQGISWGYWAWNTNGGQSTGILDTDWTTPVDAKMAAIASLLAERFPTLSASGDSDTTTSSDGTGDSGDLSSTAQQDAAAALPWLSPDTHGVIALSAGMGSVDLAREDASATWSLHWTNAEGISAGQFTDAGAITTLDGRIDFLGSSDAAVVDALYRTLLGRQSEVEGRSYWTDRLHGGMALDDIADNMLGSVEGEAVNGSLSDTAFVQRLYQETLLRDAEAEGLSYWVGRLGQGANRADVAVSFASSAEAQADLGGVAAAGLKTVDPDAAWIGFSFAALSGREITAAELSGLLPQADALGHTGLVGAIMDGSAYQDGMGALSASGFVAALYEDVLHRQGDAGGIAYYIQLLTQGTSREAVAMQFLESPEAQSFYSAYANHGLDLI